MGVDLPGTPRLSFLQRGCVWGMELPHVRRQGRKNESMWVNSFQRTTIVRDGPRTCDWNDARSRRKAEP